MIVAMKKVCLLVQNSDQNKALEKLREAGVLHIEKGNASSEGLSKALDRKAKVEEAISLVSSYKVPKQKKKRNEEALALNASESPDLVESIREMGKELKALEEQEAFFVRESGRIAPWGEIDPAKLRELACQGYPVFLYEMPTDAFSALSDKVRYMLVNTGKTVMRFLVLDEEISGVQPFQLPEKPLSKINAELDELRQKISVLHERIKALNSRLPILKKELEAIESSIEFEAALARLENVEGVPVAFGFSCLKGYIPADDLPKLKSAAKDNSWALAVDDPAPGDEPPTLLRNNPIVRLIQPLFSFLGTIPGYREFDISAPYLLFFSLFFAMIFGDAAYGLIILGFALIFGLKLKKQDGKMPDIIKLLMLLAVCTIGWGTINGNWFAIPNDNLPFFLRALIIPPFNNTGELVQFPSFLQNIFRLPAELPVDELKTQWSIQFLCFTVAVIQLTLARGTRIKKLFPSLLAIAQIGWFMVMLGLYFVVLSIMLQIELPPFVPVLLIAGVSCVLIFGEQRGGNFFVNIGKGFGGSFSLFLKLVSCFADILSYIRLFAVGLAGSMIGQVFNTLAVPADGLGAFGIGFVLRLVMVVTILVFGHGLNLALTAMAVIVHGVRLNLLEFAGNHLEMEWSGYEYKPFALKQKNK